MVGAHLLVRDRLVEFKSLAQEKGTLNGDGDGDSAEEPLRDGDTHATRAMKAGAKLLGRPGTFTSLAEPTAPSDVASKGSFMKEFFEEVAAINGVLAKGRVNVKSMDSLLEEALQATTPERQSTVSDKLNDLVQDTNGKVHTVKASLEELRRKSQEEEKAALNAEQGKVREIRKNMANQLTKKHIQLLTDFQKAQLDFKEALNQRQIREIQMVRPEATQEEVKEMLDSGTSLSLVVAQKMAGTHFALIDEVRNIQEKHQDILRLERSVADLAQMFQEMAVLVDSQGEMLDAIEVHVHKANVYTAKAEENLIVTRKAQHNAQRWMCCLAAVMLIVLLVILLPILIQKR